MRLSFDDEESFKEAAASLRFNHNPPSDTDSLALERGGSNNIMMPLQERNEDICFNKPPSDPKTTIQQLEVGSGGSSTPPQEKIEVV